MFERNYSLPFFEIFKMYGVIFSNSEIEFSRYCHILFSNFINTSIFITNSTIEFV